MVLSFNWLAQKMILLDFSNVKASYHSYYYNLLLIMPGIAYFLKHT